MQLDVRFNNLRCLLSNRFESRGLELKKKIAIYFTDDSIKVYLAVDGSIARHTLECRNAYFTFNGRSPVSKMSMDISYGKTTLRVKMRSY